MNPPRIEAIAQKKLVGMRIATRQSDNTVFQLWQSFMPRKKEIKNLVSADVISMQVFDEAFDFSNMSQDAKFEKWAVAEVSAYEDIPNGMETFTLPGGLYAVFVYKGLPAAFGPTLQYIYGTWLPASPYQADTRPAFAVMGAKYKNNDPHSEEEVYIPIKL